VAAFAADPLVEQALGKELRDESLLTRRRSGSLTTRHQRWEIERYSQMF